MDSVKTGECFVGKKIDYHHEMNAPHFEECFREKVLPGFPNKSAVVVNNACYHSRITQESKRPTTSWKKSAIKEWLMEKGTHFHKKDTKAILLQKM